MNHWEISQPRMTLTQYAEEMGIPLLHFFGGVSSYVYQALSGCTSIWYRHSWQNDDQVAQEEIAQQILFAERQVSELLGYPVAPMHVEIDMPVPGKKLKGLDGEYRSLAVNMGYIHAAGRRAETLLASDVPVVYSDEDGDGFEETGTIDVSAFSAQFAGWDDDYGELKVCPAGYGTELAIDMYRDYSNGAITVFTWNMIKPDVASRMPGSDMRPVDMDTSANRIQTVDIYRVYNDPTQAAKILFSDGTEATCTVQVEDVSAGIVRPVPDNVTLAACGTATPLRYNIGLYAGYIDQPGWTLPVGGKSRYSPYFSEVVRMLATARLTREICGCNNVATLAKELRTDMALVSPQGNFLAVADVIQECPFGTKAGEWKAWNAIKMFADKHYSAALLL
jgi:hypothetical protein